MKVVGWILLAICLFVIIALLYYLVVGSIIFHYSLGRKTLKKRVKKKNLSKNLEKYNIDLCWWDKVPFKEVKIKSFDGLNLVGHYYDAGSRKTVCLVHGYSANYKEMQQYAKYFYEKGYNLLCVENRAHGASEGKVVGMGYLDRKDLLSWLEFLGDENEVVFLGLSMGASAVCCLAGEKLPKCVKGVISDCAFDNAERELSFAMRKFGKIRKLLLKHLKSYTKRLHNFDINDADMLRFVKNTKVPILYFHGKNDTYVPYKNSQNLYNATPENLRNLVLVDDADHAMSYQILGVDYERKITNFFRKYHIFDY